MKRSARGRRRGYVIVLLAMMLFGLIAMAALVIDLGFARVAQRQLQTAAGSASMEGLRGEGDATLSFENRQAAAERFIAWTFDDDLDPTNGDDGIAGDGGAFGAGPVVDFSGGVGEPSMQAGQLMTLDPNELTYKPVPQRGTETNGQFRVSLRRGGESDTSANLFSHGPSLPFLFARGSLIGRDRIANGIAIGAESLAVTVSALSVGQPILDSSGAEIYPGAIPIGYRLSDWNGSRVEPRQIDLPKTILGQPVVEGGTATLIDGYCCIYSNVESVDRVVGFGAIRDGVTLPSYVAIANASGRLSDVWSEIDPAIRNSVRRENGMVVGGLLVAVIQGGS